MESDPTTYRGVLKRNRVEGRRERPDRLRKGVASLNRRTQATASGNVTAESTCPAIASLRFLLDALVKDDRSFTAAVNVQALATIATDNATSLPGSGSTRPSLRRLQTDR